MRRTIDVLLTARHVLIAARGTPSFNNGTVEWAEWSKEAADALDGLEDLLDRELLMKRLDMNVPEGLRRITSRGQA